MSVVCGCRNDSPRQVHLNSNLFLEYRVAVERTTLDLTNCEHISVSLSLGRLHHRLREFQRPFRNSIAGILPLFSVHWGVGVVRCISSILGVCVCFFLRGFLFESPNLKSQSQNATP